MIDQVINQIQNELYGILDESQMKSLLTSLRRHLCVFEDRKDEAIELLNEALKIAPSDSEIRPSLRDLGVKNV